jgi:ATP-dependent Clp endopeptidase proteolytic subunit ClpP
MAALGETDSTKLSPILSSGRDPSVEELDLASALADRARAEARKAVAEAVGAEAMADIAKIALAKEQEIRHRQVLADDFNHHRFLFDGVVNDASIKTCIRALNAWDRENPNCDIEIAFSSPGGSIIDGMELFDFISSLRHEGRTITTSTYGMAASMAGILLQAGDVRVCGPQAYILIHEVSFGAQGKIGEVEDEIKFIRKVQARVLDIFAERCRGAASETATRRLTRSKLARNWNRHDWWLDADEALAYGIVDKVR